MCDNNKVRNDLIIEEAEEAFLDDPGYWRDIAEAASVIFQRYSERELNDESSND